MTESGWLLFLGLLALADIEHETDQRIHLSLCVTHHMHHVAYPDVMPVLGQCAVVRFMVDTAFGLGDTEIDHPFPVFRVHAFRPVVGADPAIRGPAQQLHDLRSDIGELHGGPVDLPRDRFGGFQQGLVDSAVVLHGVDVGHLILPRLHSASSSNNCR
jgi:hypothetical protein